MKKILLLILALTVCLGLTVTASATESDFVAEEGTLTESTSTGDNATTSNSSPMPGVILIIMGLVAGAIPGAFRRIPYSKVTTGEIISVEYNEDVSADTDYRRAHVEYYVDGIPYKIKSSFWSSSFRTGQKVRVSYNQTDPQQAKLCPGISTYLIMLGFGIAGIVVICKALFK